jgi:hypothetical protein
MSIVLLQGGGLSKEQLGRVPLNRKRFLSPLAGWVDILIQRLVGKG